MAAPRRSARASTSSYASAPPKTNGTSRTYLAPPSSHDAPGGSASMKRKHSTSSENLTDLDDLLDIDSWKDSVVPPVKREQADPIPAKASTSSGRARGKGKGKVKARESDDDEDVKPAKARSRKRTRVKVDELVLPETVFPERWLESKKFIGAHVSITGGIHNSPYYALRIGAKAFGIFTKNQRQWHGKPTSADSIRLFPLHCKGQTETAINEETGKRDVITLGDGKGFDPLRHIVPHGSYLTNMCNPDKDKRKKSYDNFLDELQRAEAIGVGLFNIHPGSTVGSCTKEQAYDHIANCINDAHAATSFAIVLLENMATVKSVVGGNFSDLGQIIARVTDKSRIGVCFDTCHAFAAGYDLRSPEAYAETMRVFDEEVGLDYIKAFHVNDSREKLGGYRDLHENIGAGQLGLAAFANLMRDKRFDGLPFILETPALGRSLQVNAPSSPKKAKTEPASVESTSKFKIDPIQDAPKVEDDDEGETLSLGARTWSREIELLHELELVPVGQTNAKIKCLHDEICTIVAEATARREAAKEAQKAARKQASNGKNGKTGKKGKRGVKAEISDDDLEIDELDSAAPKPKQKKPRKKFSEIVGLAESDEEDGEGCNSHTED